MPVLRVFADDSVYNSSLLVVNLKFLIILGPTAAIQHAPLYDLPHKSLLVSHFNSGPIFGAKAAVGLPNSFVGDVLVVVLGDYFPGAMRGGQQDPQEEGGGFLEGEVDVSLFFVGLVGGGKFVLVGEVAGHEGEADGRGDGDGVVAVFEGIVDGGESEVAVVFESVPIEHHFDCQFNNYLKYYQK